MKKYIYLDNASTTQVYPEVFEAMKPYFTELYANPSSIYSFTDESKKTVENARDRIADFIGAKPEEIYFTAGGSESDNWALKASAQAFTGKGRHIITTTVEHHAILNTCKELERQGFEVTYVNVDSDGIVKIDEIKAAIRPDTILISVMTANNETGTIEPISEIGVIAREKGILFHRAAACKGALSAACRRSYTCGVMALCRKTWYCNRRPGKTG